MRIYLLDFLPVKKLREVIINFFIEHSDIYWVLFCEQHNFVPHKKFAARIFLKVSILRQS